MDFVPKFLTIVDLFEESVRRFSSRELFGTKRHGSWSWMSFAEVKRRADAFRAALGSLGVQKGQRVAFIGNNSSGWAIASFATVGLGAVFVPMYESQLAKDWEFILQDCEASVLIVSGDEIYNKVKAFPQTVPSLKHIINLSAPASSPESFGRLLEEFDSRPLAPVQVAKDDTAFFIYTSGTTGQPKGVVLSHFNIASNVSAVHHLFEIQKDDRTLSFLPWAHSFGLTVELHMILSMGASIALNSSVDKLVSEMTEVRPTILISVPRIFNRIYDGVQKQMTAKPAPIQQLFRTGLQLAARKHQGQKLSIPENVTLTLADKLVFSKVRSKFGGRLRYAISGGAALSKDVAEFIDSLGITVYEGYGLTETSPIAAANFPGHRRLGSVGLAIPGSRITLDRQVTDDPKNGEVIVYGPNIMKGYYKREQETASVLLPDGGFRTGDMGYIDSDGFLFITGRIKEQYKLENGKYVVPAPLEETLKLSPFITNIYVHGANKPFNVALIVPDFDVLREWAQKEGITGANDKALCSHPKVIEKLRSELDANSKSFKGYERVQKFALLTEDFTTANDMLTPSLKLKRRKVIELYGSLIDGMYA